MNQQLLDAIERERWPDSHFGAAEVNAALDRIRRAAEITRRAALTRRAAMDAAAQEMYEALYSVWNDPEIDVTVNDKITEIKQSLTNYENARGSK